MEGRNEVFCRSKTQVKDNCVCEISPSPSTSFQKIQVAEAYAILSDDKKREIYDKYGKSGLEAHEQGVDPEAAGFGGFGGFPGGGGGQQFHFGGGGGGFDPFSMFEEMFGSAAGGGGGGGGQHFEFNFGGGGGGFPGGGFPGGGGGFPGGGFPGGGGGFPGGGGGRQAQELFPKVATSLLSAKQNSQMPRANFCGLLSFMITTIRIASMPNRQWCNWPKRPKEHSKLVPSTVAEVRPRPNFVHPRLMFKPFLLSV